MYFEELFNTRRNTMNKLERLYKDLRVAKENSEVARDSKSKLKYIVGIGKGDLEI